LFAKFSLPISLYIERDAEAGLFFGKTQPLLASSENLGQISEEGEWGLFLAKLLPPPLNNLYKMKKILADFSL
jgi:hypothetical protein